MHRTWSARVCLLCAASLFGCGLRSSSVATRPPGEVRDAGAEPNVEPVVIDAGGPDRAAVKPKAAASAAALPEGFWLPIDCQGSGEQINDCIINAPTKSGIPATRPKPTVTYQTCGAQ